MMKLFKPLSSLSAAMLLAAAPVFAVDAPEQAIGEDTLLVVWLDLEQIDAAMIEKFGGGLAGALNNPMLQQQGIGLPLGDTDTMMADLTAFREGFVDAGGQGLLLTLGMPPADNWSPPMSLLAATDADADAQAMGALVREVSEGEIDAGVTKIDEGWHDLALWRPGGEDITLELPSPNADAYKAFDKQLGAIDEPVVSMAFRMNDAVRQMLNDAAAGGGQQDPQMAMLAGMVQLLDGLDTVGVAVSQDDEGIAVDVQMVFFDAAQANQFLQMYNAMMAFAPAILAQQMQGAEDAPDPNTLNEMFMMLQMQADGDTLKLHLDRAFFELAEQLAPALEGAAPGLNL